MADRSSQLTRLAINFEGLVGVAKVPQCQREIVTVRYARVVAGVGGPELGALAVVVGGQGFLAACTGAGKLTAVKHCGARHEQGFHEHAGVVPAFCERHSVGGQVHGQPQIAAHESPLPHAQHDPEQLFRISDPLAEFARTQQDRPNFGRSVTAHRDVGGAEGGEELQFAGIALRSLLKRI